MQTNGFRYHGSSVEDGGKALDSNFEGLATGYLKLEGAFASASTFTTLRDYTGWLAVGDPVVTSNGNGIVTAITSSLVTVDVTLTDPCTIKGPFKVKGVLSGTPNTIAYINADGDMTFLPYGSEGQALSIVSGEPAWSTGGGVTEAEVNAIAQEKAIVFRSKTRVNPTAQKLAKMQPAIANATGTATGTDAVMINELKTQLNAALDMLRTHKLIGD